MANVGLAWGKSHKTPEIIAIAPAYVGGGNTYKSRNLAPAIVCGDVELVNDLIKVRHKGNYRFYQPITFDRHQYENGCPTAGMIKVKVNGEVKDGSDLTFNLSSGDTIGFYWMSSGNTNIHQEFRNCTYIARTD